MSTAQKDARSAREEEFATQLKWCLWNDVWQTVNSDLAANFMVGTKGAATHAKKAGEDARRANEHYQKAVSLGVFGPSTVAPLRSVAVAAAHEAFRSGTGGSSIGKFIQEAALDSKNQAARGDIGEQPWAFLLAMLSSMAQLAAADISKNKVMKSRCKQTFESSAERFETVLCQSLVQARKSGPVLVEKVERVVDSKPYSSQLRPKANDKWTAEEKTLVKQTEGLFKPKVVPPNCGRNRVTVLTPTVENRQCFHELLWNCFEAQTWPNKEFVVVETYRNKPSKFFSMLAHTEKRLVYISYQLPPVRKHDWSIGFKRNLGAALATGDTIAHFDDDDLYAPDYLTTMVKEMMSRNCVAITLSSWYIFATSSQSFGYCNPMMQGSMSFLDPKDNDIKQLTYGYGFSYVYKRETVLRYPYADVNMGEDYDFFSKLLNSYGEQAIALLEDKFGLCLHMQHGGNTSRSFALWEVPENLIAELDFRHFYPVFDLYRQLAQENEQPMPPDEEAIDTFIFQMEGSGVKRRIRDITVRTGFDELRCRCSVGATCAAVLEQLKKQRESWPDGAVLYRIPPPNSNLSERERKSQISKSLKVMCPLAPPLDHYLAAGHKIDARFKDLLDRVSSPIGMDELVGAKTTDLWAVLPVTV